MRFTLELPLNISKEEIEAAQGILKEIMDWELSGERPAKRTRIFPECIIAQSLFPLQAHGGNGAKLFDFSKII